MNIQDAHVIKVDKFDIGNGYGIRTSVWFAGCNHNCFNCFNPETFKWKQGTELSEQLIQKILDTCEPDQIDGMSLLGGDPLFPKSRDGVLALCKAFRNRFGNTKTIWMWTGYNYDEVKDLEVIKLIDVLVDGRYVDSLRNISLPYCGSSNQKVIRLYQGEILGLIKDEHSDIIPKQFKGD